MIEHWNVIEGPLAFYEQEGGFRALDATIDGEPMADWMARCVGNKPEKRLDRGGNVIKEGKFDGVYRVTFERIG
jgi:hypothetical protein